MKSKHYRGLSVFVRFQWFECPEFIFSLYAFHGHFQSYFLNVLNSNFNIKFKLKFASNHENKITSLF